MAAVKRKKLYFDVVFGNASVANRTYPCTQFKSSYTGDAYGGVLDDLAPLVAGSTNQAKRLAEVCAWFVPNAALASATSPNPITLAFVPATTTAGGTGLTDAVSGLKGSTPIYTRHFGVNIRKPGLATMSGRLYVQRQHSIEV